MQQAVTPPYSNVNVNCRIALFTHYDFDFDGKTDLAMYRTTTGQWFLRNSSDGANSVVAYGSPASDDIPAPGEYTQKGKTDIAVCRYSSGEWFIRRSTDGSTRKVAWGSAKARRHAGAGGLRQATGSRTSLCSA